MGAMDRASKVWAYDSAWNLRTSGNLSSLGNMLRRGVGISRGAAGAAGTTGFRRYHSPNGLWFNLVCRGHSRPLCHPKFRRHGVTHASSKISTRSGNSSYYLGESRLPTTFAMIVSVGIAPIVQSARSMLLSLSKVKADAVCTLLKIVTGR